MFLPVATALLGTRLLVTVADQVPDLDFMASCRVATIAGTDATSQTCVRDEQSARDQVAKEWSQFSRPDRASCVAEVSGFKPSYVELLTCLEAARDAKLRPDGTVAAPNAAQQRPGTPSTVSR
jgi:hypothetical protein